MAKQVTKKNTKKPNNLRVVERSPKKTEENLQYAYTVEKNVPIISMRATYNGHRFPLGQMNIGDSFLIPASDPISKNPNTLHYAAKMYAREKPGFALTTRMQLDKARRVWRIK